jgi:ABC-type transport system involved in multi-copper enzyme maturation permease subunit
MDLLINRRSWIISTVVVLLFQAMFGGAAKLYTENDVLLEKLQSLPPSLMEAFGIRIDLMGTYEGWMSGEPFTFFVLLAGSFGVIWASSGIVKERDAGTGEFLFALPYSRWTIFIAKAASHWLQLTVMAILGILVALAFGSNNGMKEPGVIVWLGVAGYLVTLAFTGIGYIVTVFLRSERAALSIGIGVVIVSFLFNMVAGMSESMRWLSDISLFRAFATDDIVTTGALTVTGITITLGIYVCGLLLGGTLFRRQDV